MPTVDGRYVAPTWHDGAAPAINAAELQAMSDAIARADNAGAPIWVGTCDTAAETTEKVVACPEFVKRMDRFFPLHLKTEFRAMRR